MTHPPQEIWPRPYISGVENNRGDSRPEAQARRLAGLIPEAERRLESLRQAPVRSTRRPGGYQAGQGMAAKQVSNALRALPRPSMLFALLSLTVRKARFSVAVSRGMLLRRCMALKSRKAFLQRQVGRGKRSSAIKYSESHYADLSARDGRRALSRARWDLAPRRRDRARSVAPRVRSLRSPLPLEYSAIAIPIPRVPKGRKWPPRGTGNRPRYIQARSTPIVRYRWQA
jgi:hypothetical protein